MLIFRLLVMALDGLLFVLSLIMFLTVTEGWEATVWWNIVAIISIVVMQYCLYKWYANSRFKSWATKRPISMLMGSLAMIALPILASWLMQFMMVEYSTPMGPEMWAPRQTYYVASPDAIYVQITAMILALIIIFSKSGHIKRYKL